MQNINDTIETALAWHAAGKAVALATVIETWGSAPRPVGSQLVISENAEIMGSVSGGCVEGAVVEEALEALKSGTCALLEYGVTNEDAFAVGLACGGTIRIVVEPVGTGQGPALAVLEAIAAARAQRRPVGYAVHMETWQRRVLTADDPMVSDRFISDKSGLDENWYIGIYNPPLRMVIVGAVHIAQALVQMAQISGFAPTVIDPRAAFATKARFPNTALSHEWPDEALKAMALDGRCAVITLSHDPKIDDPAILAALAAPVFYLGCLGAQRTHAKRLARLAQAGISAADQARIHAPVGADIGAKTPAEIAIAIMAEVTERLRCPESRP